MIGKGTFFESSIHIPMIVRMPDSVPSGLTAGENDQLVSLTDVTATILAAAGIDVPAYMDSRPLPGVGLPGEATHEALIGATQGGWWIDDGRWRLCKYSDAGPFLFDGLSDPAEQHNLAHGTECQDVRDRLDACLTSTVMAFTSESHFDHRVYMRDLSQRPAFGREGWQRPFPRSVHDPQARRQD
jgi:arylsulfatase A-like enzyme